MAIDLGGQPSESSPTIKLAQVGAQWQAAMIDVGEFHARDYDDNEPLYWQPDNRQGTMVNDQPVMSPVVTYMLIAQQGCTTGPDDNLKEPQPGMIFSEFMQGAKFIEYRDALDAHTTRDRGFCVGDITTHWREADVPLERGKVRKMRKFHHAANTDAAMVQRCEQLHLDKNRTELTPPAPAVNPAAAVGGPPAMGAPVTPPITQATPTAQVPPAMTQPQAAAPAQAAVPAAAGGPPPMGAPAQGGLLPGEEAF